MAVFALSKHEGLERARRLAEGYRADLGRAPGFRLQLPRAAAAPELRAEGSARGSLYLYEQIGRSWWSDSGTTAKMVADALAELKAAGAQSLDIFINSPGGNIFEAKAIYAELRRFEGERTVHVDGIAASAASFIAMAGDKIITAPAATWMIHDVWAMGMGNATELRKLADVLELESNTFAETYAARSKSKVEDVKAWMHAETWMNAKTALERGFTDEISEADEAGAEDDKAEDDAKSRVEEALNTAVRTLRAMRAA